MNESRRLKGAGVLVCLTLSLTLFGATHDAVAADRTVMIEVFGATW